MLAFATSCQTNEVPLQRFEFQEPQMGVPFRIVLYAPDEPRAEAVAKAAFARVSHLNSLLSDYDYDSELSRLSRTSGSGQKVPISPELWTVLKHGQSFAQQSEGAFDMTVGPAVNLWRKARREKRFPDEARLAEARKAVGYRNLVLNEKTRTAELLVPNMRLDLGGIAKGYAIDEAMQVLKRHGVTRALISGGGDIVVSEPPPGRSSWRIELPPLQENGVASEFLHLRNQAMATSGDLFQFVELDGKRYSHIVDPRTGIGLTDRSRVVVVTDKGITADALSTTVSVLGGEKGWNLAKTFPSTAVRISWKTGEEVETLETKNFARLLRERAK
ncbi:MAG: FAD:protein FMN transferase [Limisphaerales bacterium]